MKRLVELYFIVCFVINIVQLSECDFKDDNVQPEIVHAIGLADPLASGVTVWL